MADVTFDLRSTAAYIQSFAGLAGALSPRDSGRVLQVEVVFSSGTVNLFMEAASLYIIGFRNGRGQIIALDGDDQPFGKYLKDKLDKEKVNESAIKAKYGGDTWKLKLLKDTLDQTCFLNSFAAGDTRITLAKEHIDRMAFAIAEAARFIPIRCAVACVLHDDYRFLAVLERLSNHAKKLIRQERKAQAIEPGKTLSPRDAHLRSIYPAGNIHVFEMSGNSFDGLSKTERWFRLLLASDTDLSGDDRERLRSLPASHWHELTIGDFRNLVTNWSKLSAAKDPYIHEILQELHIRNAVSSTSEDTSRFMTEWH